MVNRLICILLLVFLIGDYTHGTETKSYSLDKLDWLVGHWQGEAFGGTIEEDWNPSSGGSMVGSFKLVVDNKVAFYEIMTITADSTGYNLKLKHFNADLTGWEEKNDVITFPYVSSSEKQIKFNGLEYKLQSDDTMKIVVGLKSNDNEHQVIIDCVRVNRR
jgi:hypothetical protein